MSRHVEQAVSGLVQSFFGSWSKSQLFGAGHVSYDTQPTLGFLSFLEKAQFSQQQSVEAEECFYKSALADWLSELSNPSCGFVRINDILQCALVAASRGYTFEALHIHALKLTQATKLCHRKTGYLYLSACQAGSSDLGLMVTNTLHKELLSNDPSQLFIALTVLPSLLPSSLPTQLCDALLHCLRHPFSLVRRRTLQVMFAGISLWGSVESGSSSKGETEQWSKFAVELLQREQCVVTLLQMLSDSDPGVAVAATQTLALLYQHCPERMMCVRNAVACAAAYLLNQAINCNLPQHYSNSPPLQAPHLQLAMVRVLGMLNGPADDWTYPHAVVDVLITLLTQVWNRGEAAKGMILLEAALLVLEHKQLRHKSGTLAANKLLELLKDDRGLFRLSVVQTMIRHWKACHETVTELHLEVLVQGLESSRWPLLTRATLRLLYTLANDRNYQTVVSTLVSYCNMSGLTVLREELLTLVAKLLSRVHVDPVWCCAQLQHLVLLSDTKVLSQALFGLLLKGLKEDDRCLSVTTLGLLEALLGHPTQCQVRHAAPLLGRLNHVLINSPEQEKKLLLTVNNLFINSIEELSQPEDAGIIKCLVYIGLSTAELRTEVLKKLELSVNSDSVGCRIDGREALAWLRNPTVAMRVLKLQKEIISEPHQLDWSLPFLEQYVYNALNESDCVPYLPFTIAVASTDISANEHLHGSKMTDSLVVHTQNDDCCAKDEVCVNEESSVSLVPRLLCNTSPPSSSQQTDSDQVGTSSQSARSIQMSAAPLWSSEGRSPTHGRLLPSGLLQLPSSEGIEFGSEAREELHSCTVSSASSLAKALYAGLSSHRPP